MIYNVVLKKCCFTCIPNRENKRIEVICTLLEESVGSPSYFSDVPV